MKHWIGIGVAVGIVASVGVDALIVVTARAAEAESVPSDAGGMDREAQIRKGKILFISNGCGWCHEDGGRRQGRGPPLMNTVRDDEFIINRIVGGSPGRMPSFAQQLGADDIHALIAYIRSLKPES